MAPVPPISAEPSRECRRGLLVNLPAYPQRFVLQLRPTPFDPRHEGAVRCRTRKIFPRGHRTLAQNRQVMIVAQIFRELTSPLHETGEPPGSQRFEELQLIAEVLRLLTPLMQALISAAVLRSSKCAPSLRISALQSRP